MIDETRFKECSALLAIALNPVEEQEEFELDGKKIDLHQLLPIVFKHINKIALKHEDRAEEIFLFMVESIHYFTGITDEKPQVTYLDESQMELRNSGYKKDDVRVARCNQQILST
jgi:hypothetical protein